MYAPYGYLKLQPAAMMFAGLGSRYVAAAAPRLVKLAVQLGDLSLLHRLLDGPLHGVLKQGLSLPWEEMAADLIPFCTEDCQLSAQILQVAIADVQKMQPRVPWQIGPGMDFKRPTWFEKGYRQLEKSIDTAEGAWKDGDSLGQEVKLQWGSGGMHKPYLEVSRFC
jgi:hypothetical protein